MLESALVARLASVCTVPVEGALNPVAAGTEKRLTADTFVSVTVDRASQDGDYAYRAPMTYTATVAVHVALADDPGGNLYRAERAAVNAALMPLVGDGCSALNIANVFVCDSFVLGSTSTSFDGGENPVYTKSYTATIKGRIINPQPTTEA